MIRSALMVILYGTSLCAAPVDGTTARRLIIEAATAEGHDIEPQLSVRRGFPPCQTTPIAQPKDPSWNTVVLTCSGPAGWQRVIRTDAAPSVARVKTRASAKAMRTGVVLIESLPRDTILSAHHLETVQFRYRGQIEPIQDFTAAIGRRLKSNLRANQPLLARHLDHDWMVQNETPVKITIQHGPISIDAAGIAIENGQLGQDIRVINPTSNRVLYVTVTGPNKVKMRPNIK